jgi:hypothetical protein
MSAPMSISAASGSERLVVRQSEPVIFPYDYAFDLGETPDWQARLYLSAPYGVLRDATLQLVRGLLKSIARISEEDKQRAYVASLRLVAPWTAAVLEAGLILDRMERVEFVTGIPEVRYLAGTASGDEIDPDPRRVIRVASCRRPLARQFVWTKEWTPWWKLASALADPEVEVFNRNPALVSAARASRRRIRYANVETIYAEAMRSAPATAAKTWDKEEVAFLLTTALEGLVIAEPLRGRMLDLMTARYLAVLNAIMDQLQALRAVPSLPNEIWAGTGGYWPSRIVGLEIMRRGGIVRRFDHGFNKGLSRQVEQFAFVEGAVSTDFVFASEESAQRWRREPLSEFLPAVMAPRLHGLPPAEAAPANRTSRRPRQPSVRLRPRVMYAPGQLKGFWQVLPSKLPNLVYLDWSVRLASMLNTLPIDLICRPHPNGPFGGAKHPLAGVATIPEERFEELLDGVDVVITDSPFSRVLCAALGSDKPIIYLDPGHDYFADEVLPRVQERCTIITLDYDGRGLPQIDAAALEYAIFHPRAVDPERVDWFRRLLASD